MKKTCLLSTFLILLTLLLATSGFAANGEPLKLESSNPENGAVDIAVDLAEIELKFSKNVVNMTVAENNKTCVDFVDGEGNQVPFELVMADDQVDREKRDLLYIKPEAALKEGTTYIVKISKALTSKSGTALEEDLEVSFATAGGAAAETSAEDNDTSSMPVIIIALAVVIVGAVVMRRKRK